MSGGWFRCPASAWPTLLEAVRAQRPLERDEAIADLRWQLDQHGEVMSRRGCARRWGWSEWATRDLLASERDWRIDVRPISAQSPPNPRPASAHSDTDEPEQMETNRPPAAQSPPSHLPTTSTRAFDPDFRLQTQTSDSSQPEARRVRAEAVAAVLAGWLARGHLTSEERATWEAGGETFLRRLRKAVDAERHLGALGLPDLREGIRLALARYDAEGERASPAVERNAPQDAPDDLDPGDDTSAISTAASDRWDVFAEASVEDEAPAPAPAAPAEPSACDLLAELAQADLRLARSRASWGGLRPERAGGALVLDAPASPTLRTWLAEAAAARGRALRWRNAA